MTSPDGARFDLRLQSSNEQLAVYLGHFDGEGFAHQLEATVNGDSGEVLWAEQPTPPIPAWILKYATVALRAGWRSHQSDGWPRRLTRWRAAPAGSTSE